MKTIEYRTIDKSAWPRGPWDVEPDKRQWQDEATGLPCLIVRQAGLGHLCGYVGVTEGHPCFQKDYEHEETADLHVHGGITFGSFCQDGAEGEVVCHVPGDGEPYQVWWIGFDCAHAGDRSNLPHGRLEYSFARGDVYRDFQYVENECADLAGQLAEMAKAGV